MKRTDTNGDSLPRNALVRLGSIRFRHEDTVTAVVFARDCKKVISAGLDKTTRVWDVATGEELKKLVGNAAGVRALSLSRDGKLLATVDTTILLWDLASGKKLRHIECNSKELGVVCFSPDGARIAWIGDDNTICINETATGKESLRLPSLPAHVRSLDFTPNGQELFAGSIDGCITFWDARTGKRLRGWRHDNLAFAVLSPNGRSLASTTFDAVTCVWDVASGKLTRTLEREAGGVCSLAYSPDCRILATGNALYDITLWDASRAKVIRRLRGHSGEVICVAFSRDGKLLVSGSRDRTIRVWNVMDGKEIRPFPHHGGALTCLAFSPSGEYIATGCDDKKVRLWQASTGRQLCIMAGHTDRIAQTVFSHDGRVMVSIGEDGTARLWNVSTRKESWTIRKKRWHPECAAFSSDGAELVICCNDMNICFVDVKTGTMKDRTIKVRQCLSGVALADDKSKILVAGNKTTELIEVQTGRVMEIARWPADAYGSAVCQLGKQSFMAASLVQKSCCLATIAGDNRPREIWEARTSGPAMALSPDGRSLALEGDNGGVDIWEIASRKTRYHLAGHQGGIVAMAFSPDGLKLATAGEDETVLVWAIDEVVKSRFNWQTNGRAFPEAELWNRLGSNDAASAYGATMALRASPQESFRLAKSKLRACAPVSRMRLDRLLNDLDADDYAIRKAAATELQAQGETVEPALRIALTKKCSRTVERSIKRILYKLENGELSRVQIREVRMVEVLELICTYDARTILADLSKGTASARLTREATFALHRINQRLRTQSSERKP
jgi:WD40 repeat protein